MDKEVKRLAIVLSTGGLENDDRIRKESIAIQKDGRYTVKIFAKVTENKYKEGVTSWGTPYKLVYLKSRDIFTSSKFLIFKVLEMYFRLRKELKEYDLLWFADDSMSIFPLLLRKKIIIWDLHEIPKLFLKNNFIKRLFHFIERKCNLIIHANQFRLNYLIEHKVILQKSKHIVIRNYPDIEFINSTYLPKFYNDIRTWLNGSEYVYLQGISADSRYPYNSIASILDASDYKIVVTAGNVNENIKKILLREFGQSFFDRVFFTGMLDQLYTPSIIKDAVFSMVYYNTSTPNNRYCEANRFYQSLVLGVPVICGCNEPMKEIIDKYHCGIALRSDGSDLIEIKNAIKKLFKNYTFYKTNTINVKDIFVWDDQHISTILSNKII